MRRKWLPYVIGILAVLLLVVVVMVVLTLRNPYAKALIAMNRKDYLAAAHMVEGESTYLALNLAGTCYMNYAAAHLDSLDYYGNKAIACYNRSIATWPDSSKTYLMKALALRVMKRSEEALGAIDTAIRLDPTWYNGYYEKGELLSDLGRYSEALEFNAVSLRRGLGHERWFYGQRAEIFAHLDQPDSSLAWLDRYKAIRKGLNTTEWLLRANELMALKRFDEARACADSLRAMPKPDTMSANLLERKLTRVMDAEK